MSTDEQATTINNNAIENQLGIAIPSNEKLLFNKNSLKLLNIKLSTAFEYLYTILKAPSPTIPIEVVFIIFF